MKTAAVLSGDGLYSSGFSSAHVFFVAVFLSQILDHHLLIAFCKAVVAFFSDKNMDGK